MIKHYYLLFLVFSLSLLSAQFLDQFDDREKKLIISFKDFAYLKKFTEAEDLLKQTQYKIANFQLNPKFSLNDLFTTYYFPKNEEIDSDLADLFKANIPQQANSFLSDFCYQMSNKLDDEAINFYEKIIQRVGNSDPHAYNGETPLFIIASRDPNYSIFTLEQKNDEVACARLLLSNGANPSFKVAYSGSKVFSKNKDHSPLSIALINGNFPLVKLFNEYIDPNSPMLSLFESELIRASSGEIFDSKLKNKNQILDLYKVANQFINISLVKKLQQDFPDIKKYETQLLDLWKQSPNVIKKSQDEYFYPPLWIYNIDDLKSYAEKVIKQLQPHVISKDKLIKTKNETLFNYDLNNERILLLRKTIKPLVGRILGADHLKNCNRLVARKFIVEPENGLINSRVTFTLPGYTSYGAENMLDITQGLNSINIEIEDIELYVEYIEGNRESTFRSCGFIDNDKSNSIRSQKSGNLYIIDTGDDKNFIVPSGNPRANYIAKALHFAPHLRLITLDLSKN